MLRSPSDAASAFFEAIRQARWADAAALVDPDAAAELREQQLAMLIAWAQHRDELRRMRESGEGSTMFGFSSNGVIDPELLAAHATIPLLAFSGKPTLGELAAVSTTTFIELLLKVSNGEVGPDKDGPFQRPGRRVIGEVREGDALAHVLYRAEGAGIRYSNPHHVEVLQLRRAGDGWRILLTSSQHDLADGGLMLHMDTPESGSDPDPDGVE
jgi:hypothetical protein